LTRLDLALRLHGKFNTAFPDGPPGDEDAGDDEEAEGDEEKTAESGDKEEPRGLKESLEPGTVILVGDADMLYDRFCVRELSFFGFTAHQPVNDNLALVANILEQISGSPALVTIRTRGKTQRPFDVVVELQKKAQAQYMAEERRLQDELQTAQQQLNELQAKKDDAQRFILSPEQKAKIDEFQEKVLDTKGKLRVVRRNLREDIEQLGIRLKIVNILLMPVLVALAGVGFGFYRRSRTRG
jgi:ABC-type uncharacterized transport system involved in gliding motility auxiliary subunit